MSGSGLDRGRPGDPDGHRTVGVRGAAVARAPGGSGAAIHHAGAASQEMACPEREAENEEGCSQSESIQSHGAILAVFPQAIRPDRDMDTLSERRTGDIRKAIGKMIHDRYFTPTKTIRPVV
jgi:hypothetical protein